MSAVPFPVDSYSIAYHRRSGFAEIVHYQDEKPVSYMRVDSPTLYEYAKALMKCYDMLEGIR